MDIQRLVIAVTTDADGNFTGYTPPVSGRILQVRYVPHGSTPIDTNGDLDITGEDSGVVVANHDNIGTSAFTRAYRQAAHGVDGAALVYTSDDEPVTDYVVVARERLKLVIANGDNTKSGTFYLWVG